MENYHKILGLKAGATKPQIKKAYRTLAKKYHPDKNKSEDASKIFLLVNLAYEVLYYDKPVKSRRKTHKEGETNTQDKWKDVNVPPKDRNDFREWKKVKQQQVKERMEFEREEASKRFQDQRNKLKSSIMYIPAYLGYLLVSIFLYTSSFSILTFGIVYGIYEDSVFMFAILFLLMGVLSVVVFLMARFVRLEIKKYF